jgi:hypothetical protein
MSLQTANSINYKTVEQFSGRYRYLRLPLNNITSNTVTLSATASQLLEWKLPVAVYNLGRSYISYSDPLKLIVGNGIYGYDNTLEIAQSLTFGTAGGLNLADVNYANNYINVARPIDTPIDTFLSNDVTSGMSKSESVASNIFPPTFIAQANNIFKLPAAITTTSATSYEPKYCSVSSVLGLGNCVVRNFPLSGVTNTIVAMDRDQFFPDNMYLRINTATSLKIGFTANSLSNPAAALAQLSSLPVLNNIYLYLAIEKDQTIVDSIMSKYASGQLKYQIPFTSTFRNSVGSGNATVQIQLNSQYGKKLKRVLTTNFNANETLNNAYDHHNWNGAKVTTYQSFLDSNPLQDSVMSCLQPDTSDASIAAGTGLQNFDDWRENAKHCKNTAIQNGAAYQLNWFHADKFAEKNFYSDIPEDNINEGLDLTRPLAWSIVMNTTAACTNYTFCSFIRDLVITPSGPMYA